MEFYWRPEWILPYESLWSICNKFAYINGAGISALFPDGGLSFSHSYNDSIETVGCSGWQFPQIAEKLGIPDDHFRDVTVSHFSFGQYSARIKTDRIRYCPECMKYGYHSYLFQYLTTEKCPLHNTPLIQTDIMNRISPRLAVFPYSEHDPETGQFNVLSQDKLIPALDQARDEIRKKMLSGSRLELIEILRTSASLPVDIPAVCFETKERVFSLNEAEVTDRTNAISRELSGSLDPDSCNYLVTHPYEMSALYFHFKKALLRKMMGAYSSEELRHYAAYLDGVLETQENQDLTRLFHTLHRAMQRNMAQEDLLMISQSGNNRQTWFDQCHLTAMYLLTNELPAGEQIVLTYELLRVHFEQLYHEGKDVYFIIMYGLGGLELYMARRAEI